MLSLGACLGFSAIALPAMMSEENQRMTSNQASWIGNYPILINNTNCQQKIDENFNENLITYCKQIIYFDILNKI